jgi:glycosyltransferase involved in cell wall biosynthesis
VRTDADYPRTLIVGAHFSEQSGAGTFLGRLFSGWPVERLTTVCGGALSLDWRRCRRHYRTGDLEFRLRPPFKGLVPAAASGAVLPSVTAVSPALAPPPTISLGRRLAQYPWRVLLQLLGGGEILYRVGPSPQLVAWARESQPEVLYGHCSSLNSVRFLRRMQQALGLPLVLHFMDDWPATLYGESWTSRILRPRYLTEFAELVRSANVAIAICQDMEQEYGKRYQRPVLSLPMPVELDAYQAAARSQWTAGHPFRLRYGGRVGWAIHESLADLARAIHTLREQGADVVFDLVTFQTKQVPAACFASGGVSVQIPGPLRDLPRLQAEADVLVICYDFDPESFRQARYSMPSKLAECMASGTPILVYGPAGLPVVEYARREGWGKVVDSRDPLALGTAVRELMGSPGLREQLGRTAKRLAAERHDARMVSESFRAILRGVAAGASGSTV